MDASAKTEFHCFEDPCSINAAISITVLETYISVFALESDGRDGFARREETLRTSYGFRVYSFHKLDKFRAPALRRKVLTVARQAVRIMDAS